MFALACAIAAGAGSAQPRAVPVFDMAVRIHTDDPALDVEGQVVVPARNSPIDSVELQIDRRIRDLDVAVVSPASAGPGTLATQNRSAVVTLASPVPAGSMITLRFRYRIAEHATRSFYIARDAALISGESAFWYPLPSSHRRATGRLRFLAPESVTVVSTGRRIGARDADGWVRFEVNDPATFSFAAGRHEVYTSPGDPVIALHLLRPRTRASERLALIRRILTALVDEFGRFPHPDLEVVEMPDAAMGGTGNGTSLEGFVVVSSDMIERASLLTLGHEISHQWWADSVYAIGAAPTLIGEAMVNYGALRAIEAIHGERAAAEVRWHGYPGDSLLAGGRAHLAVARAGLDGALTSASADPLVAGNKGMLVHDLLSRTIGRDRFKSVLRTFAREHAFQDTSWQAFTEAVRAANPDIGWFFDQWYASATVPSWDVSWTQKGDEVRGVITQSAPYFRADVEVVMQSSGRREMRQLRIDGPRTEFAWQTGFAVADVQVDPDYKVPHNSPDRSADVDAIASLGPVLKAMRGGSSFNEAVRAAFAADRGDTARDFVREAILGGIAFDEGDWETARQHVDAALASRAPLPEVLPGLYYTQALLAQRRGDRPTLERAARAVIDADSRLVAPTGWNIAARELLEPPSQPSQK